MPLPGFHSPVDQPAYGSPPSDKLFAVRAGPSTEVALCNASEILESAAVSAYDCAEHLDGAAASKCWRWCNGWRWRSYWWMRRWIGSARWPDQNRNPTGNINLRWELACLR
ncbi:DUF6124 family protein [Pseudomonas capeferrum]